MTDIEDLHRRAMDLAEQADSQGSDLALLQQAFKLERAAALLGVERQAPQPSLAILFRSAASLGLECGMVGEARALVEQALGWRDSLPEDLVEELLELRQSDPNVRSAP